MVGRGTSWGVGLFVLLLLFILQSVGGAEERYAVKSGDSLYKIAKAYGVSIDAIKTANHLERENLKLNQVLLIPASKERQTGETPKTSSGSPDSVVKKGESLHSISKKTGLSIEEIRRINQLRTTRLTAGQTLTLSMPQKTAEDPDEESGEGEDEETPEAVSEVGQTENQEVSDSSEKWKSENERNLFVRLVKTFLGVPYRLGGSTLKGIDCSAFVKKIYEVFNIELPRTTWEQIRFGKRVKKDELAEGDLVFFKIPTRRASNRHVGIYIGNNEFVHASSRNKEVRVDNLDTPYFSKCFLNGVRVRELEGEL
jgi:cell wall-associated NlpC family hydrolase